MLQILSKSTGVAEINCRSDQQSYILSIYWASKCMEFTCLKPAMIVFFFSNFLLENIKESVLKQDQFVELISPQLGH